MNVQALGRTAKFGEIYDANTNEFVGINILRERLHPSHIDSEENPNSSYMFSFGTRESEKMDSFDIHGELKLRIWCGMVSVSGAASFIKNDRNCKKSIQCSYILKTMTKKESINWRLKEFANHFDLDGIEGKGTHMITGIQYGGNGVVTLSYSLNEHSNAHDIKGGLSGKFKCFPNVNPTFNAQGQNTASNIIKNEDLDVKVKADVNFEPGDNVTSVEGAKKFMENLSTRLHQYNGGKGVQVSFEMIPLKTIFQYFKKNILDEMIYRSLENYIIASISQKLNDIEEVKEDLNERIYQLEYDQKYFTKNEQEWWRDEKTKIEKHISIGYGKMDQILKLFHGQDCKAEETLDAESTKIAELRQSAASFISSSEKLIVKSDFIKTSEKYGVTYVAQESQLARIKLENKHIYVCFFSASNYYTHYNLLTNFINESNSPERKPNVFYCLIDADILSTVVKSELKLANLPKHPLYVFENGKYFEDPATKPVSKKHRIAVGIDLGTTNSCVAVYGNNGIEVIADCSGNKTTPSYVLFEHSKIIVGNEAKYAKTDKYNKRIYDAKRMIGKSFFDPLLQQDMKRWMFKVEKDPQNRPVILMEDFKNEPWVYPENISAYILHAMKEIVEKMHLGTGEEISEAVITVPAYFNDTQREATKRAAELAGLTCLKLLNEPSAAALAFFYHKQIFLERKVLVYDLGGGTFDVSVMAINQGMIEVKAVAGDTHLGGNDFDHILLDFCIERFQQTSKQNIKQNESAIRKLKNSCLIAKEHLSTAFKYDFEIENVQNGIDFEETITRAEFESACSELFNRTIRIVDRALKDANLLPKDIDEVLLVGGSSRIPKLQEMLTHKFGAQKINKTINADEAIAYGAAVQAAILTGDIENQCNIVLMDIASLSIGVSIKTCKCNFSCNCELATSIIVPRNSKIPTKKTATYQTAFDNQEEVKIEIVEGENYEANKNHLLATFVAFGIPKNKKYAESIDISFELDANGSLLVTSKIVSTGRQAGTTIDYKNERLSEDEIRKMLSNF